MKKKGFTWFILYFIFRPILLVGMIPVFLIAGFKEIKRLGFREFLRRYKE